MPFRVGSIFKPSAPAQIDQNVVALVTVMMATLHSFWCRPNKCAENKSMNINQF